MDDAFSLISHVHVRCIAFCLIALDATNLVGPILIPALSVELLIRSIHRYSSIAITPQCFDVRRTSLTQNPFFLVSIGISHQFLKGRRDINHLKKEKKGKFFTEETALLTLERYRLSLDSRNLNAMNYTSEGPKLVPTVVS